MLFREKCASAIDFSWKHSWHWPQHNWETIALGQAEDRRDYYISRLAALQEVIGDLRKVAAAQRPDGQAPDELREVLADALDGSPLDTIPDPEKTDAK